jgi:hypothetical protein
MALIPAPVSPVSRGRFELELIPLSAPAFHRPVEDVEQFAVLVYMHLPRIDRLEDNRAGEPHRRQHGEILHAGRHVSRADRPAGRFSCHGYGILAIAGRQGQQRLAKPTRSPRADRIRIGCGNRLELLEEYDK